MTPQPNTRSVDDASHADTGTDSFLGETDWMLGQSDKTTAGCLWAIIAPLCLSGLLPLGMLVKLLFDGLVRGLAVEPIVASAALTFTTFAACLPGLLIGYFRKDKSGWYGRVTKRLMERERHHQALLQGPITLLPGIRLNLRRRGVLFYVPLRLVVLSKGWHTWILVLAFVLVALVLIVTDFRALLTQLFWATPVIAYIGARRVVFHEVNYDEIEDVSVKGGVCTLSFAGGPLYPALLVQPETEEAAQEIAHVIRAAQNAGPEVGGAIDTSLETLQALDELQRRGEE